MDYRWKDLYISIMPGFCFMAYLLIAVYYSEVLSDDLNFGIGLVVKNGGLSVSLILFVSIIIGYFINGLSSQIEHSLYNCGVSLHPLADDDTVKYTRMDKIKKNKEVSELLHKAKTILPPNEKVEEYYVRYAQARNMYYMHIFILISVFFIGLVCFDISHICHFPCFCIHTLRCSFILQLIYHLLTGIVEYWQYHHQRRRYEEVIRDERDNYEKESAKLEMKCPCFKK